MRKKGPGTPPENVMSQMPRGGSVPKSKEQSTLVNTSTSLRKRTDLSMQFGNTETIGNLYMKGFSEAGGQQSDWNSLSEQNMKWREVIHASLPRFWWAR